MVHRPLVPTSWFSRPAETHAAPSSAEDLLNPLLERGEFLRLLTPDQIRELAALRRERDPALLAEALLALAQRFERTENLAAAIEVYSTLVGAVRERPLRNFATTRLNALTGNAPWQDRFETLGRRFVAQATDPAMVFSFAVAGGLAAWVRRASLASLATRSGGLLTRGYGARLVAGTAAYLAEVPAFVGAGRLSRAVLSPAPNVAGETGLAEEFAGAALFLGTLKLSGFAGHELIAGLTRDAGLRAAGGVLSGLGGIYLAHRLQEGAGLRPHQDEANRWVDSIDAWLQMMVGARLVGANSRGAALEARLQRLIHGTDLTSIDRPSATWERISVAASFEDSTLRSPAEANGPLQFTPVRQAMVERWGESGVRAFIYDLEGSARLLGPSAETLESLCLRSELQDAEVLRVGWGRLHYMLRYSDAQGRRGHYLNWISRLFAVESVRQGDMRSLDLLFTELHRGTVLDRIERIVAMQFPSYDLFSVLPLGRRSAAQPSILSFDAFRDAAALPLSAETRGILRTFLRYQGKVPAQLLTQLNELLRSEPEWKSAVEAALLQARRSPLAYLRILRLLNVTERGERLYPKILELGSEETWIHGYREREISPFGDLPGFGSQQDGFLADTHFSHYLADFQREWKMSRRTVQRMLHVTWATALIREIWPTPRALTREDLVEALARLEDPMTLPIARALRDHDFNLRILEDREFNESARRLNGDDRGDLWSAYTVRGDPSYPQDQVVIRQVRNVSPAIFPDLVFERLVALVHEFEHHAHPATAASPQIILLREEMAAHLRHLHFRARNGFTDSVEEILRVSPLGLGMYLRDRIETDYLRRSGTPASRLLALEPPSEASGERERRIEDAAAYASRLLEFSLAGTLDILRRGAPAAEARGPIRDWLMEVGRSLEEQRRELRAWIEATPDGGPPELERAALRYEVLQRSQENLVEALNLLSREPSPADLARIRRRVDWVLSEGEWGRSFDWSEAPWFRDLAAAAPSASDRFVFGGHLLQNFLENPSREDLELFESVARGPLRGRDIAFDLDDTLGDTVARHVAFRLHQLIPDRYDLDPRHTVHQYLRIRLAYRHMQSLALGLWAAGNRLRLFTASDNYPGNHDAFFNDYPLFKVAFELVPPQAPEILLRSEDLEHSPRFMDRSKYRRRHSELFGTRQGRSFLRRVMQERGLADPIAFGGSKIPLPGFPFEVLVDDAASFDVDMRTAGLGERWVRAATDGRAQWESLIEFFSRPREVSTESWNRWLERGPEPEPRGRDEHR